MARKYGLPYKGSKNAIARDIVEFLPDADVLVDICAGGCAVTHCALEMGKYNRVVANDVNEGIVTLFKDAVDGKYKGESRWISRDTFFALKESDPYVKYCWSFGNNGKDYLYSRKIEPYKKALHELFFAETVNERRVKYRTVIRELNAFLIASGKYLGGDVSLQSLESLERLEISSKDYAEVKIPQNAIVYADIPYEGTDAGSYGDFDHRRFYDWAAKSAAPIYVSSYNIADERFTEVWSKKKTVLSSAKGGGIYAIEKIYANKAGIVKLSEVRL